MIGYISKLFGIPGLQYGSVTAHGTNGATYLFGNYSAIVLKLQAQVTFDISSVDAPGFPAGSAENIVWDGVTYDVPAGQIQQSQTSEFQRP